MPALRLEQFTGIVPRTGPTLLEGNQAQVAKNVKLQSMELRPWRAPTLEFTPSRTNAQTIYKFSGPAGTTAKWLEWVEDVDVVPGPVADTTEFRLYYTSSGFSPKKTNWALATGNNAGSAPYPNAQYEMGVPAPTTACSAVSAGVLPANTVTLDATTVVNFAVGDILRVTVDLNAAVLVTLTAGTGGDVTAASLATQLGAITGLTAVATNGTVVLTTVSTSASSQITVEKKTSTTQNYDPTVVTYTTFISTVYGTNGTPNTAATYTFTSANIAAITPDEYLEVKVNNNPPVAGQVAAGAGTFPTAVTASSLVTALGAISGITAVLNAGATETVTVTTVATGSSASFGVRVINPRLDPVYTVIAQTVSPTSLTETRSYVYTYVTVFGAVSEESAPSPAVLVNAAYSGDSVTLSGFASTPSGNYNFQYIRIYRSVIGATTSNYQLVTEMPVSSGTYTDTKKVAALGLTLPSLYYTPPPSTLQGLVAMPNGMMAGFTGNQIWFCEPYLPHAWPSIYMLTTDYPIVGLGVFGNSLFVGTTRNPYVITGTTPTSMSQEKLPIIQPCVSKKSITSDQFGVLYGSPNGLVAIGQGTQDVISNALFTRDEWQAINPSSLVGAVYNNMYFGFYNVSGTRNSFVLMRGDTPPLSNFDSATRAVFIEPTTGILYALSNTDNKVYSLDTSTSTNTVYQWKSKKFLQPAPISYAGLQVHADYAYMAAHAGSYVNVKLYADGVTVFDSNITSDYPVRIAAVKAYVWELDVYGNVPVRRISVATSMAELAGT